MLHRFAVKVVRYSNKLVPRVVVALRDIPPPGGVPSRTGRFRSLPVTAVLNVSWHNIERKRYERGCVETPTSVHVRKQKKFQTTRVDFARHRPDYSCLA